MNDIHPGDTITIDGWRFDVQSRGERVENHRRTLTGFHVMAHEHDPLTDRTIARLTVEAEPYELAVCNGPTHEIEPERIEPAGDPE